MSFIFRSCAKNDKKCSLGPTKGKEMSHWNLHPRYCSPKRWNPWITKVSVTTNTNRRIWQTLHNCNMSVQDWLKTNSLKKICMKLNSKWRTQTQIYKEVEKTRGTKGGAIKRTHKTNDANNNRWKITSWFTQGLWLWKLAKQNLRF